MTLPTTTEARRDWFAEKAMGYWKLGNGMWKSPPRVSVGQLLSSEHPCGPHTLDRVAELMREYCPKWLVSLKQYPPGWVSNSAREDSNTGQRTYGSTEIDARWALLVACWAADHPE